MNVKATEATLYNLPASAQLCDWNATERAEARIIVIPLVSDRWVVWDATERDCPVIWSGTPAEFRLLLATAESFELRDDYDNDATL